VPAKFVVYADSGGKYRWRLESSNGQTIASSGESFASKSSAREAAENALRRRASPRSQRRRREGRPASGRHRRALRHVCGA
jgi:uncharacterized protein YegP (UPF0339 family)